MKFHFDAYDRADSPTLILCNPTDAPIGELFNYTNLNISLCFSDISELSFDISQFFDDEVTGSRVENTLYKKLHEGREILVSDIMVRDEGNSSADRDLGYFIISEVSEESDGDNFVKSVTARSCEYELSNRGLHYVDGTFKIYEQDNDECLLNQILKRIPKWEIGTVSSSVADIYRTFDYEASLNVYDFLITSFAESCNCLIEFDILHRVINVFDKSTYLDITTQRTHIAISLEDVVDKMSINTGIDGLYTALYVPAVDDLNIASVNPARENIIYNFDYYKTTDWMSQELIDAINRCEIAQNLASTTNKKYVAVYSPLESIGDTKDTILKDNEYAFKASVYNNGINYNNNFYYNTETQHGSELTNNVSRGDGKWKLIKKIGSATLTSDSPIDLVNYNSAYMCFKSNALLPYRLKGTDTKFTSAPKLASPDAVKAMTQEGYYVYDEESPDEGKVLQISSNGKSIKFNNQQSIRIKTLTVSGISRLSHSNVSFTNPATLAHPSNISVSVSSDGYKESSCSINRTLMGIGGSHDSIYIDSSGHGKLIKRTGLYELTGDEQIEHLHNDSGLGFDAFTIHIPEISNVVNRSEQDILCTHFDCSVCDENTLSILKVTKLAEDSYDSSDPDASEYYNSGMCEFVYTSVGSSAQMSLDDFKSILKESYDNGTPVQVLYGLSDSTQSALTDDEVDGLLSLLDYRNTNYENVIVSSAQINCINIVATYNVLTGSTFLWSVPRDAFHNSGSDGSMPMDNMAFKQWLDDCSKNGDPVMVSYVQRRYKELPLSDTLQTQLDDKYPDGGTLSKGSTTGGENGTVSVYDRIISPEYTAILVNKFDIQVEVYNEKDGGSAPTEGVATYFPTEGQNTGDYYLADHNYTKNLGGVDTIIITEDDVTVYRFDGQGYELTQIEDVDVSEVLITTLKYEKEKESYVESVLTTLKDADLVNYEAQKSAIVSSSATDDIKNEALVVVNKEIAKTKDSIAKWTRVLSNKSALIKQIEDRLENIAKRIRFEDNLSPELLDELYCFIREGEYSDDNLITTEIMSYAEEIDQSTKLFNQAMDVLSQISTPSREFNIEVGSTLYDVEFKPLLQEINTGSIIGVFDTDDNVEEYVLKQIDINDEDRTIDLVFGNRLRMSDPKSVYADIYENISKTNNTVDYIKQTFDFREANNELTAINDFRNSSLDLSRNAIVSSSDQDMIIDRNGLRGRKVNADTGEVDPEQIWISNNTITFSDDGYNTVKTALGKIPIPAGMLNNEELVYRYGINGEVIIGKILLGERAVIGNEDGSVSIGGDGIVISNGKLTIKDSNGDTILDGDGINAEKLAVGNIKFEKEYACTYEYFSTHKATGSNAANMGTYMLTFYGLNFPENTPEYKAANETLDELEISSDDITTIVTTMNGIFDPDGNGVIDPDEAYIYGLFSKLEGQKTRVEAVGHTMTIPSQITYKYSLELDRSLTHPLSVSQHFDIAPYYYDGAVANVDVDEKRFDSSITADQISTSYIFANSISSNKSRKYDGYNFVSGDGAASISRKEYKVPEWDIGANGISTISGFTSGPLDAFPQGGGTSEYRSAINALTVRYKDTSGYIRNKKWLDIVYPVGCVVMTSTNSNPGLRWGGKWNAAQSIGGQYAWVRAED